MRYIFSLLSIFLLATIVSATPPQDVLLSYNKETQELTVYVRHVSDDLSKHYIRRVSISKNGGKPTEVHWAKQPSPVEFEEKIPYEANGGDIIHVKLWCSDGGSKEAAIEVAKDAAKEAAAEESPQEEAPQEETVQPLEIQKDSGGY